MTDFEPPAAAEDLRHMRRALDLARNGLGLASPNPMVGAVVVAAGKVVGEGWHEGPGTPHAEVNALRAAGERARGSTLYVTLEPCGHQGRTPPCAPAILAARVARVVAAMPDPNPVVDGRGFEMLRGGGVGVARGVLRPEAERLIAGFTKHVRTGLPLVTLKMAASLDGKVAARDGSSRWVTGEAARGDVHRMRAAADAIMVGSGAAMADDPALTVRLTGYRGRPPLRVVADGRGRAAARGKLFDRSAPTLVATTPGVSLDARRRWEAAGAEVAILDDPNDSGRVDLMALAALLGKRDVQDLLIEGGPTLAWGAVEAGIVDRFVLYLAPKLIGGSGAPGVLAGSGVATVAEAMEAEIVEVEPIGSDLRVVAVVRTGDRPRGAKRIPATGRSASSRVEG